MKRKFEEKKDKKRRLKDTDGDGLEDDDEM